MNCNMMIGEVRMYLGEVAPFGWEFTEGQSCDKVLYQNLYQVIGDRYTANPGGNTFDLPDFTNKFPTMRPLGTQGGSEETTLTVDNLPAHNHLVNCDNNVVNNNNQINTNFPERAIPGQTGAFDYEYSYQAPNATMHENMIQETGSNLPFNNLPPWVGVKFIIYTGV